jgi:gamma-D-glutamyl-L-lysine dipeptidyl-peptidase
MTPLLVEEHGLGCRTVRVDVATMWSRPTAPRALDASATADEPDMCAWTSALDVDARLGLHGRTETQLLRGEPVEILEEGSAGWVRVAAPWQPSPKHPRGYPGWVRSAHLAPEAAAAARTPPPQVLDAEPVAITDWARRFVGLQYLWGGLSRYGLDCSGLVHLTFREAGLVVPRDASAQHAAARPVPLGEERTGDLYFFAGDDGRVFHVGFVTGRLRMLHAPETAQRIEDAPLAADRQATLAAAGRFLD